nr:MAG TPA: hypothetical protein [Caudoviricetes sp.]
MKIELTVEEAKVLLNCIYGTQCIASTYPEMPKPEVKTLSSSEVHNHIVSMCRSKSVTLYINNIKMYQSKEPDYDEIAEFLIPYEDEIVSMKEIENTWYVNTL